VNDRLPPAKEISQYLQKATEKLRSATLLLEQGFYEDAISRAYYAAFHAIIALLSYKKIDLSQHKHTYLLNQFRSNFIDENIFSIDVYTKILNLKNIRENADYSISQEISQAKTKQLIIDAKTIVETIKEYLNKAQGMLGESVLNENK